MLKTGSSGGIYIHPWDITDEGIDTCYDFLGEVCGLNELFVAAAYHAGTFILPHNPKRMVRWDDGGIYFRPQHPRWSATRIRPAVGEGVDTHGYMDRIVDRARARDWGVLFFVVFNYSVPLPQQYPELCCVDAMGERHRTYLCPANPDVRAYNLAIVADLLGTYGGDGIRHESLGFGSWKHVFLCDKVEVQPAPRDGFLLSLCFCGHCRQRACPAGFDPEPLRLAVRAHLYDSLPANPGSFDTGEADEEWMRNAFDGDLWQYLEVRCETTASLFGAVQELCNEYGAAFMPFGNEAGRQVARGIDFSLIRPHLKRVSLAAPGATPEEKRAGLKAGVAAVPEYAVPEIMHNQRSFDSAEALCAAVGMARDAGIRHHSFHYYGMSRRHELEWIGHARDAWA